MYSIYGKKVYSYIVFFFTQHEAGADSNGQLFSLTDLEEETGYDAPAKNEPIYGRFDDWPLSRPGDTRPYFDYLLVVFSGDDTYAMEKRDDMRKVCSFSHTSRVCVFVRVCVISYSPVLHGSWPQGRLLCWPRQFPLMYFVLFIVHSLHSSALTDGIRRRTTSDKFC